MTKDEVASMIETALNDFRVSVVHRGFHMRRNPVEDWCSARTQKGTRCLNDAHQDGLCVKHWREANNDYKPSPKTTAAQKRREMYG